MKKRKYKNKFLIICLIAFISIGFAALSTTLNIGGTALIPNHRFDVHFENIQEVSSNIEPNVKPRVVDNTAVEGEFTLKNPGDYYKFTVDVVNSGTMPVEIAEIVKPTLTTEQKQLLDFSIAYEDGQLISLNDGINPGSMLTMFVNLTFKEDAPLELFNEETSLDLGINFSIDYQRADSDTNYIELQYEPQTLPNLYSNGPSGFSSYYNNAKSITFGSTISPPQNVIKSWNITQTGYQPLMIYAVENSANSQYYDIYIQSKGKMLFPVDCTRFFYDLQNLETINGLENVISSQTTNMSSMFFRSNKLTSLNLSSFDTSNVTNLSDMFRECFNLTSLDISNFNTEKVTNMSSMFAFCKKLDTLNVSKFNTTATTNMSKMFYLCSGLTSLDLSNFDTSNVTNMSYMFDSCKSVDRLDLSNFNTSKVTDMSYMFQCLEFAKINFTSFSTSNVKNMSNMFGSCVGTSVDVSFFNTSNVTDIDSMFSGCSGLTSLDLSNFNTSKITTLSQVFSNCSGLTSINLSSFDTSKVTRMDNLFENCSSLSELDLSNFIIGKMSHVSQMFRGCTSLLNLDISKATFTSVSYDYDMFQSVPNGITIKVKDSTVKTYIENRLKEENVTGTVTIATA